MSTHAPSPAPEPWTGAYVRPRIGLDDTPPHVRKIMIEGYRRMSPSDKLKRVRELTRGVQQMALLRLQRQYPDATPREHQMRLASLWIDDETMKKAFGWDPEEMGR